MHLSLYVDITRILELSSSSHLKIIMWYHFWSHDTSLYGQLFPVFREIQNNRTISIKMCSLLKANIIRWLELSFRNSGCKVTNLLCHQIWPQNMTIYGQNIQSFPRMVNLS